MTNTLTTKAISAVLAVLATTTSFAEIASARTYEFSYSPVELENAEAREQLQDRIADFARNACATSSPLHTHKMKRVCREEMTAQVEAQIWAEGE